jgi:hypothetical protein
MRAHKSLKTNNIKDKLKDMSPSMSDVPSSPSKGSLDKNDSSLLASFLNQLDSSHSQTLTNSSDSSSTPNKEANDGPSSSLENNGDKKALANDNNKENKLVSNLRTQNAKFIDTIDFVGTYLQNVVQLASPFDNPEQNKLTYEVIIFY